MASNMVIVRRGGKERGAPEWHEGALAVLNVGGTFRSHREHGRMEAGGGGGVLPAVLLVAQSCRWLLLALALAVMGPCRQMSVGLESARGVGTHTPSPYTWCYR